MTDEVIVRTAVLFPQTWSDKRLNFKRHIIVYRDGSIGERILLKVLDERHREQLILLHYLQKLARGLDQDIALTLLNRDKPWDFRISIAGRGECNVEITAISDAGQRFVYESREAEMQRASQSETITLRQLIKLESVFPDEAKRSIITSLREAGRKPSDLVPNPYYREEGPFVFLGGTVPPETDLSALLRKAIEDKHAKPHADKSETVLIIDNRTVTFDLPDFVEALDAISDLAEASPFPEIWIYTGYFSDDDGQNAEFTFVAVKTTDEFHAAHAARVTEQGLDEHGRLVF